VRPTFLVIGGQRCATTWLFEVLRQHPEVFVPDDKEPDFWNRKVLGEWTVGDYGNLFEPARSLGKPFRGSMSVNYSILDAQFVHGISKLLPSLRLVFTMRHPVDRAWSQAKLVFRMMKNEWRPAPKARTRPSTHIPLARFIRFFETQRCILRNDYARTIDIWSGAFGQEALHLDLYDRVKKDPRGYLADIFEHVGADPAWSPSDELIGQTVHTSQKCDMPEIARWYLSSQWLEPTQRLNDRLNGQLSHWVEDLKAHASAAKPSWRLYRALNRHVLTVPERVAYSVYSTQRSNRMRRKYDELLADRKETLRVLDGRPDPASVEDAQVPRPTLPFDDDDVPPTDAVRSERDAQV
jgi:hypothetical protein